VGASGWDYRVPFVGSVEEAFDEVRKQVLVSGDYIWPWDDLEPDDEDDDESAPRPSTLDALRAAKEIEEFWEEGTHSILDMERVGADDQFGVVRPLSATELSDVFGTQEPAAVDLERVGEERLLDLLGERWTGRSLVLHKDGKPDEVYFWGYSGD
jgi:hypothetical protein